MKLICLLAITFLITGCVTGYQKSGFTGGYSDSPLNNGTIQLKYQGNGSNSPAMVEEFWHRRAAELCASGYDVLEKNGGSNTAYAPIEVDHPFVKGVIRCKDAAGISDDRK